MVREHNTTEHSKEAKKSRRNALRIAEKSGLEKKCAECGSIEELELDHKDHDPFNNDISNFRYLCKPCHLALHSDGFRKREDYQTCSVCEKIRVCAPSPIDKILICTACFKNQITQKGFSSQDIIEPIKFTKSGLPVTWYSLWCAGRPKYRK